MSTGGPTLSSAKLALAIKRLRTECPEADLVNSDPIAIIGMGCRFPGEVRSPEDYWQLLRQGTDAITKTPPDRWDSEAFYDPDPLSPGKMNSCWGGFLSGQDEFDPLFFGISPREASSIDPQQRLLLEVAWETLWDSGRAPESLAGSRTGVFIAMSNSDYERMLFEDGGAIGPHTCTGGYRSVASGRISFLLDLHGPSISVDTACSSSLSVIHSACQSLRSLECDLALAGGVTLHLLPGHYIGLAKLGMLAPDGRCRTFDASASGFVPSEGCGMVTLKRLGDALSGGDRIYAVIRGTALNQDGRTNVLTAPSGLAQQAVIRLALQNGQVGSADVTYIETHGTGTALGDPIEVEALAQAIGAPIPGALPCALGAVKTNLGHLEAAAGIAGLMKAALALEHQEIPKNLHFERLNPNISLEGTRFFLPTSTTPWPRAERPRFAGVSSFGFSGTNAHVVLEEAPHVPTRQEIASVKRPYVLPISARTPEALRSFAQAYRSFLERGGREIPLYDICHTAACRRSHLEERLAVTAPDRSELCRLLEDFADGRPHAGVARGRAAHGAAGVVFVCSGQGSQWARMGVTLLREEPVFRAVMEECEQLIQGHAGWSLEEQLSAPPERSRLADTEYAQPAIFAIEVALAKLWQSWGIVPAAIIGHSAGEVAAAHIAGVLSLAEAARVVVIRGRLMQGATGGGKMGTIHLPAARVARDLAFWRAKVSIAAINSPESTVISGHPEAVEEVLKMWRARGVECRLLQVNYAFHSSQMWPYAEKLVRALGSVETHPEKIPILSTTLGRVARGDEFDVHYWGRNARGTVLFGAAVQTAIEREFRTFLEIGPHPVLLGSAGECLGVESKVENLIPSMRRNQDEWMVMLSSLSALYAAGCAIDWKSVYRRTAPAVGLPVYPYQRHRYWLETRPAPPINELHPLLGRRLRSPFIKGWVFETQLSTHSPSYLADHKVEGRTLLPMTAFLEMAQRAAQEAAGRRQALLDVTIVDALELFNDRHSTVQLVLEGDVFKVFSLQGEEWKLNATGRVSDAGIADETLTLPGDGQLSGSDAHYERLRDLGFDFGLAFRTIDGLLARPQETWVRVRLPAAQKRESTQYLFHPSLLDGCLQTAIAGASATLEGIYLPFSLEYLEVYRPAGNVVWARAISRPTGNRDLLSDIEVRDSAGALLARVVGLRLKQRLRTGSNIYTVEWRQAVRGKPDEAIVGEVLIVSGDPASGEALAGVLRSRGHVVRLTSPDVPLDIPAAVGAVIRLGDPDLQSTLSLVQQLALRCSIRPPRLWIITRGAVAAYPGDQCEGIWQAPVWGLARTVAMEHPELRCTRLDLDPNFADYGELADEIANGDGEEEIAFRGGKRLTPRLARSSIDIAPAKHWTISERGSIEKLTLAPLQRRAPAAGEIEVAVEASALNFRDVLNVLGMYPGDPGPPGLDFCGRIVRVGPGVTVQPGERVMGLAWGALASFVTTSVGLVVPVPSGWQPADAAAVPNAFLTAWHCLVRVGRIQRGERVLIHAGTGGVGLAAIQVAQQAGAEIFTTAGSEEKRAYLRSLGIQHVFSSRTLDFSREISRITAGRGVDMVLNSLAGEFIEAGFASLAERGRFIEIGKSRIWKEEQVAALKKPAQYFVVDLGTVIDAVPDLIKSDLQAFRRAFETGSFRPMPTTVFGFEDAPSAFRHMAHAKHMGKIVLRHPTGLRIAPDATYLITGGLGAIGLEVAQWLITRGARHLVLMGRNAPTNPTAEVIEAMQRGGAQVEIRTGDVAQRAEVEVVLQDLARSMPALAGVVHAAGVLDDGVITRQTSDRIARVMAAKATGAWNLHQLTALMPLDFFILCSSVASLTGSPGQAGYAAGNAFLDALAHYRQARGLTALSVNWGAWADAGMAARVHEQGRAQALPCIRPMSAQECLKCLEQAASHGNAQVAVVDMDWAQLKPAPTLISELIPHGGQPKPASPPDDFLTALQAAPIGNRKKLWMDHLRGTAVRILGLTSSYLIDERQPLIQLGLDSLMAVEFRNQLAAVLKRPLSATLLFDHPTIANLADFLEEGAAPAPTERRDALLESLETLSEADADVLLRIELEGG